ncbi:protein-tyrosine phosphatase-like protein [Cantharellus anzutake]|uniref:protein-tyrosine phosphatase-like protein n=1 Tax=Cantharellus anzutake TaxID=1750568 RepID=UPI001908EBD8|nr:protein-tyrosine phosphatase-like protein [Cantharellus anzutake]KAF8333090.1 protein-tyrosine phosphatase-like protein [Cantharellus anzutake]
MSIQNIDEAELQSRFAFYSTQKGRTSGNRALNRYYDVIAYDRGCCMVNSGSSSEEQVYLNGNWVREHAGGRWWLATQAPLPSTMHSFFALCTPLTPPHQRIRTIVQLTAAMEGRWRKADPYVPLTVGPGGTLRFAPPTKPTDPSKAPPTIEVTLLFRKTLEDAQSIQNTLQVRLVPPSASSAGGNDRAGSKSIVEHFYFDAWPDNGVPNTTGSIIQLAKAVDKTNRASCSVTASSSGKSVAVDMASLPQSSAPPSSEVLPSVAPIMAHCSAGIGRTGTFIAISSVLRANGLLDHTGDQLDPSAPPPAHSPLGELISAELKADIIAQEVDSLREQRPGMLQRPEQTLFVYDVLAEALTEAQGPSNWDQA